MTKKEYREYKAKEISVLGIITMGCFSLPMGIHGMFTWQHNSDWCTKLRVMHQLSEDPFVVASLAPMLFFIGVLIGVLDKEMSPITLFFWLMACLFFGLGMWNIVSAFL